MDGIVVSSTARVLRRVFSECIETQPYPIVLTAEVKNAPSDQILNCKGKSIQKYFSHIETLSTGDDRQTNDLRYLLEDYIVSHETEDSLSKAHVRKLSYNNENLVVKKIQMTINRQRKYTVLIGVAGIAAPDNVGMAERIGREIEAECNMMTKL